MEDLREQLGTIPKDKKSKSNLIEGEDLGDFIRERQKRFEPEVKPDSKIDLRTLVYLALLSVFFSGFIIGITIGLLW